MPFYLTTFTKEQGLSQNSITCSTTDGKGFHWFATQDGLNRFDGYEFTRFKHNPAKPSISGNWITDCLKTDAKHIWFSTTTNGLNRLNTETGQFNTFNQSSKPAITNEHIFAIASQKEHILWLAHNKGKLTRVDTKTNTVQLFTYAQPSTNFKDIAFDLKNNLLLASNNGLIKFDTTTKQFSYIKNSPNAIWKLKNTPNGKLLVGSKTGLTLFNFLDQTPEKVAQFNNIWITDLLFDDEHNLWVSTYGDGLFYKHNQQAINAKFQQLVHSSEQKNTLADNHLLSLYQDPQGLIWIGTDGYGLQRYDKRQAQFNHQKREVDNPASLTHNFIRAILKDSNQQLWVGTRSGLNKGINGHYTHYKADKKSGSGLTNDNIFSLYEDSKKRIWIGTYGAGLLRYNPLTDNFTAFTVKSHQLSSNRVYAITEDKNNNLWLGSNNGLTRFNPDTLHVKNFKYSDSANRLSNNTVFSLIYDKYNNAIWAGTRAGLNKLSLNNATFTHYQSDTKKPYSLSNNMVTSLYLQDASTLWIGTFEGLNKLNIFTHQIKSTTENQGLPNNNIFAIKPANDGALWLSSNHGLIRYLPSNQQTQLFLPANGIQNTSFILGAAYKDHEVLYFGGINGFNKFNPSQLSFSSHPPTPVITDLLINNQPVKTKQYTKGSANLDKLISYSNNLFFKESEGVIGFKFSALNSIEPPSEYKYAYKLAGLDKQFLYADHKQRQVNYSQLPAGEYQFILKVSDQYGKWSDTKTLAYITVIPPWWRNNFAYAGYISLILLIMWLIIAARYKAKIAEQQSAKEKELNALKTQLLDNVSHELKTPLSLILAPLQSLQQNHKDADTQQKLAMIHRNSHKLLDQINQLLQLSQRPSTAIANVTPYSLNSLIAQLVEDFSVLFKKKSITFEYNDLTTRSINIVLEHTHAVSIISNLLSNAQKYTPAGGKVSLTLSAYSQTVTLVVSDTGIGIKAEHLTTIFKRFTRINGDNGTGSGIGLALVKQLTEQYGGTIAVKSQINKGSRFSVSLPIADAHNEHYKVQQALTINGTKIQTSTKILIIEDNEEMCDLLTSLFIDNYTCLSTSNGQLGLNLCKSEMPDIVISDVMMPVMDGYQFIKTLRSETAISHIPVLLLSAKADTQSRLKGLDLLADDYLSKPFEPQLLISRVQGLLTLREMLNQHLTQHLPALSQSIQLDPQMVQSKDYRFTERLKSIATSNYQNEAFSVEDFASALCLSPRALQLKMKSLYNLTPSDYLRNIRLEFAQQLLKSSDLPIGLIAQQVGFNSQSYFARCFKTKFSLSPKQYREQSSSISHM